MESSSAFRRAFHIVSPIFLGYYLLPEDLGGGISRTAATFLFLGTAACVEIARIALGIRLFVIQDLRIVVPVFLGMAWIDPLAAFCRSRGWSRVVPTVGYFGLFLRTVLLMKAFSLSNALLF